MCAKHLFPVANTRKNSDKKSVKQRPKRRRDSQRGDNAEEQIKGRRNNVKL